MLELKNITASHAGAYVCSLKNLTNNASEIQVSLVYCHPMPHFAFDDNLSNIRNSHIAERNCRGIRTAYFRQEADESSLSER